jgi:uncharacterized lipoprotein YbaY
LNGDVNQVTRVPIGSNLIVRLQDTSMADAPAKILKQIQISNLFAFPFSYQLDIPTNIAPASYSLSAEIKKDNTLLFINDQHIPVTINGDSSMSIDIPVINVNQGLKFVLQRNKSHILI